jgi:hypothetical protein
MSPENGNRPGEGAANSVGIDNATEHTRRPATTQARPIATVGERPRLAPPEERAKAREVARLAMLFDPTIRNWLVLLTMVCVAFPGISLQTALAGVVFRRLLAKPDHEHRVLQ